MGPPGRCRRGSGAGRTARGRRGPIPPGSDCHRRQQPPMHRRRRRPSRGRGRRWRRRASSQPRRWDWHSPCPSLRRRKKKRERERVFALEKMMGRGRELAMRERVRVTETVRGGVYKGEGWLMRPASYACTGARLHVLDFCNATRVHDCTSRLLHRDPRLRVNNCTCPRV